MVGSRTLPTLAICLAASTVIFTVGHELTATGDDGDPRATRNVGASTDSESEQTPAKRITNLSDDELAALARGGDLPKAWPSDLSLSRERLNELLLEELARRWERQTSTSSESGPNADAQPSLAEDAQTTATVLGTADQKPSAQPDRTVEIRIEAVATEVIAGDPMGVGRMEIKFVSGHEPTVYPDQRLRLNSSDRRSHYAAFDIDYVDDDVAHRHRVKRIEALFLVRGGDALNLSLRGPAGELHRERITPIAHQSTTYQHVRSRWWKHFSDPRETTSEDASELKTALLDMLARRHGFAIPIQTQASSTAETLNTLEGQFERAIGMLFGIESVKLAMQKNVVLQTSTTRPIADRPIPARRAMRSIQIPDFQQGWIEPIAMRVPEECFYLRTGSLSNYLYFRNFLKGWGGTLDDIVASRTLDRDLRSKIELQLGFDSTLISNAEIDNLVSDMALIGCDPLFQDGAAVGVLFEARDGGKLADEIKKHRRLIRMNHAGVDERRLADTRYAVSFLTTDDNRVRSFYAISGSYHLVTNSRYLLDRFFQADQGDRSLGSPHEFGYARSKVASKRDSIAFLYLSDPFFQLLVSPHYRVEMTRRAEAARELRQLRLAHMIARSERLPAESMRDLKDARLLPSNFALRPDNSTPVRHGDRYEDSMRGGEGVFLPVPDVPLEMVTAGESQSYTRFLNAYNRQWRRVDPVTVVLSKNLPPSKSSLQSLGLEILVTPYAQQRYATLNRHLADAQRESLQPGISDLLSVQAAVRVGQGYPSHLLSIGLSDDRVDFTIEDGTVQLQDERDGLTFAKSRAYVAITPPSTPVLKMLAATLMGAQASGARTAAVPRKQASHRIPPPSFLPSAAPNIASILYGFGWAFSEVPPKAIQTVGYLSLIETQENMTVVSMKERIRDQAFREVTKGRVNQPHKVTLSMRSLADTKVEPYIQAYTFLEARRSSSRNARMLNDWTDWLQIAPSQSRSTVERLLGGKIHCPLGGDYEMSLDGDSVIWSGTAWSEPSRYQISQTPPTWKFPFLDWLQGLNLKFDIDRNTLHAKIGLLVRQPGEQENLLVALRNNDPNWLRTSAKVETSQPLPPDNTGDWVLGIRVPRDRMPLRVSSVHPGSPAWREGIRAGDEIASIDGESPRSSAHLIQLIATAQQNGFTVVVLERKGRQIARRVALN